MKGPTPDAKLAAMGLNGLVSSVRQLFVEAGTDSGESCIAANEARMGVCKPLMPDVLSLRDLCRFGFTMQNLAWWAVTQRTLKNHKTVKIGGVGACSGQYGTSKIA